MSIDDEKTALTTLDLSHAATTSEAPFMTDFVAEWRLGFSAEQASYRSFVVLMEVKLRQGLLVTAPSAWRKVVTASVSAFRIRRLAALHRKRVTITIRSSRSSWTSS